MYSPFLSNVSGKILKILVRGKGMKIINPSPLIDDFQFPEIVDRQRERQLLIDRVINSLLEGKQPAGFYYITGGSGSGKTFVTTRSIRDNYQEIKKKLPRFEYIYVNVAQDGIPSYTEFYSRINHKLSSYLPVKGSDGMKVDTIKAWKSRSVQTDIFTSIIEQKQINLLLVVDEVEKILEISKGDIIYYQLADLHNKFIGKSFGVFVIFITNDKTLASKIVDKTDSRMSMHDNYSNYTIVDLFEILKVAAKYSCDVVDELDLIQSVAQEIADTSCSARDAKRLLYNRIERGNMDEALIELDKDSLRDDLINLNQQQRAVLQAVLASTEEFERMQKRNIPGKYKDKFVTTQKAYIKYGKITETMFIKTRSYRTFIRILDGLSHLGIISYERVSKGRGHGWAGKIELISGIDFVKDTLLELLKKEQFIVHSGPPLSVHSGFPLSGPPGQCPLEQFPAEVTVDPARDVVVADSEQEKKIHTPK